MVKWGVGMGLAIYVIEKLLAIVMVAVKARKGPEETQMKESSRERIKETNDNINTIKQPFFNMKDQLDDVHEIVTAKNNNGIPVIYNPELNRSIDNLNNTMNNLSQSIKTLADKQ